MTEPYLGEIHTFAFPFAPKGWAHCDGQLMSIAQNTALFALLGTMFGGDGRVTFALPDMRGRFPLQRGDGRVPGEMGGSANSTLLQSQTGHTHAAVVSTKPADSTSPAGKVWAVSSVAAYGEGSDAVMPSVAVSSTGSSQSHGNLQPYLTVNFSIALQGLYPSRY